MTMILTDLLPSKAKKVNKDIKMVAIFCRWIQKILPVVRLRDQFSIPENQLLLKPNQGNIVIVRHIVIEYLLNQRINQSAFYCK